MLASFEIADPTLDLSLPRRAESSVGAVSEALEDLGGESRALRRTEPKRGFEDLLGLSPADSLAVAPSLRHENPAPSRSIATSTPATAPNLRAGGGAHRFAYTV